MRREPRCFALRPNSPWSTSVQDTSCAFRSVLLTLDPMIRPLAPCCAVLLLGLALLPGCALWKGRADAGRRVAMEKALAEARQHPVRVGRIVLVNADAHFVLIDAASAQTPRAGAVWRAYSGGALTAELRATGVRRRPWVIADIVQGKPAAGDLVVQPAEAEPTAAPRAEAVQHDPPTPPVRSLPFWKRWLGFRQG